MQLSKLLASLAVAEHIGPKLALYYEPITSLSSTCCTRTQRQTQNPALLIMNYSRSHIRETHHQLFLTSWYRIPSQLRKIFNMLSSRPSVLVIGATGNIGDYITSSLIESKDAFSKITVFTSEATVSNKSELLNKWKEAGVHIFAGDVTNPADITKAYSGIEVVISCVGRAVLHQQKELIRLAEESESVQWFFPSEYGTDIEHNDKSPTERPHQVKLAVRKYIREHTKRLRVTYVVVGPYFEMWLSGGSSMDQFGGFDLENNKAVLIGDGAERIGFTTMSE